WMVSSKQMSAMCFRMGSGRYGIAKHSPKCAITTKPASGIKSRSAKIAMGGRNTNMRRKCATACSFVALPNSLTTTESTAWKTGRVACSAATRNHRATSLRILWPPSRRFEVGADLSSIMLVDTHDEPRTAPRVLERRQGAPVSVILPNYNHGSLLPRSLGALAQQSVAPQEILVVDDGSTDNSVAVIEAYRRRCDRIRLIRHATNQGAFAAVRTG